MRKSSNNSAKSTKLTMLGMKIENKLQTNMAKRVTKQQQNNE